MALTHFQVRIETYSYYEPRADFISNSSIFRTWVVVIPESGEFFYESKGHKGVVGPGDFATIVPRAAFMRQATKPPICYHVIRWNFLDELGQKNDHCWEGGRYSPRDSGRYAENLAMLKELGSRWDEFSIRQMEIVWHELLLMGWEAKHTPDESKDPTMRVAARLLREKASTPFSMSEISDAVELSPVQLTRRFRAAHGVTPIEYLTRIRLEIVERMLLNTNLSLQEIAEQVGWSTENYLSSVFVKHRGLPPGQFRKLHRL